MMKKPMPFGDKISLHRFSMTQMQSGGNWVSDQIKAQIAGSAIRGLRNS
jgi:hypothetical protein